MLIIRKIYIILIIRKELLRLFPTCWSITSHWWRYEQLNKGGTLLSLGSTVAVVLSAVLYCLQDVVIICMVSNCIASSSSFPFVVVLLHCKYGWSPVPILLHDLPCKLHDYFQKRKGIIPFTFLLKICTFCYLNWIV